MKNGSRLHKETSRVACSPGAIVCISLFLDVSRGHFCLQSTNVCSLLEGCLYDNARQAFTSYILTVVVCQVSGYGASRNEDVVRCQQGCGEEEAGRN